MDGKTTIVIVVAVILVIWLMTSKSCGESFAPERGTSMYSLADNAYSKYQLPDYTERVRYDLDSVEGYHPHDLCQMQCHQETGGRKAVCIAQCMSQQSGTDRGISCSDDKDCPHGDICVLGGAYSGMTDRGTCMDPREPFTFESESDRPITCSPGDFFNAYAERCEPRFQGRSSAYAINHMPPPERPEVSIPGSVTPCYGVGSTDPFDVKTNVTIY